MAPENYIEQKEGLGGQSHVLIGVCDCSQVLELLYMLDQVRMTGMFSRPVTCQEAGVLVNVRTNVSPDEAVSLMAQV